VAVAYDAFSSSAGGTGTQSWTHTPVGTPRGVIVFVVMFNGVDEISTVTYGGTSMTEVTGSPNLLTGGEAGGVHCFYLGSSIPTGAQTVVATASATTGAKAAFAISLTGSDNTEVVDTDVAINGAAVTNPSVTLALGGRTSFCALAGYSGQNATTSITELAGWTSRSEGTTGTESSLVYTYDTVGSSDVTAGWTQASDDAVMVALAVSEVVAPGSTAVPVFVHNLRQQGIS
jgi:hypothetical protein